MSLIKNLGKKEEEENIDLKLPKKIFIGYEKGASSQDLKDVMSYIHSYAEDNFSTKKNAFYKIKKIKDNEFLPDGHIFEIQEGGDGSSYLDSVVSKLEEKDEVVIQTSEKQLFVQKAYDSISSYYLTEDLKQDPDVFDTDKSLTPLVKQGHVFMFTGIVFFSLSVISLFLAALFKYVLFTDGQERLVDNRDWQTIPVQRINQRWNSNFEFQTISVQLDNGIWILNKKFFNYTQDEETGLFKEGEIKYEKEKINNFSRVKNEVNNQDKRINADIKKNK
jgi:hypothetical protein